MSEIWKPIIGLDGHYEISSIGRIRKLYFRNGTACFKLKSPIILKTRKTKAGYITWGHKKNKKGSYIFVHSMMLIAFVGPRPKNMVAAHLNGNKTDNRIENLKWVTQKENQSHRKIHGTFYFGQQMSHSKLKNSDIKKIFKDYNVNGFTQKQIGQKYGISRSAISLILLKKTWKQVIKKALEARGEA